MVDERFDDKDSLKLGKYQLHPEHQQMSSKCPDVLCEFLPLVRLIPVDIVLINGHELLLSIKSIKTFVLIGNDLSTYLIVHYRAISIPLPRRRLGIGQS